MSARNGTTEKELEALRRLVLAINKELDALRPVVLAHGKALNTLEQRIEALENPEEDPRAAEIAERSRAQFDRKIRELESDVDELRRQK